MIFMKKPLLSHMLILISLVLATLTSNAAEIKGDSQSGQSKVWMCTGCHSIPEYRADYPKVYRVPMLGGQSSAYIATALAEYKKGERKHPTMRSVAASLSEQDMADIGEYYAAQTSTSPINPLK